MGAWYTLGLVAGLGTALGVLLAGPLAPVRAGPVVAPALAAALAALGGWLAFGWPEALGGAAGGALGALGAVAIVRGALRSGGTPGGTALLVMAAAAGLAVLALVPFAGYLAGVAVPALAARLRRRGARRYAGLRILARDQ